MTVVNALSATASAVATAACTKRQLRTPDAAGSEPMGCSRRRRR
jgi:hypothetical protein